MPQVPIGSQKGDSPKTPTLRQYYTQKQGNVPPRSLVTIVFRPNKVPNYSMVSEHGFRVSVMEDNPLHSIITDSLEHWSEDGVSLFIQIDDGQKGYWTLCTDTNESCSWEEKAWGYKIVGEEKRKTRPSSKAARP